jgi:hypothetical protein
MTTFNSQAGQPYDPNETAFAPADRNTEALVITPAQP